MSRSGSEPALVIRAGAGDEAAWNEIIERYAPLVWSVCARYRLSPADAGNAGQGVWLLLADHVAAIPEPDSLAEPAALAGWLAATTQRECLSVLRTAGRDRADSPELAAVTLSDLSAEVAAAERGAALRAALAELPPGSRALLAGLASDPPAPCTEISATLGLAASSIGPERSRSLELLRRSPHLAALEPGGLALHSRPDNSRT